MKTQVIPPTGVAQHFEINESFFSMTDARGVITAGNMVFSRTSGYALTELLGQAHNIIRHPDIPRCVFKMLWENGNAGLPFMGYVKNHAKNGNHYWVFAVIEPVPRGYLSIRIKPSARNLASICELYDRMIEIEERALVEGGSPEEAIRLSRLELDLVVRSLGFECYDAFSRSCISEELKSRDCILKERELPLFPLGLRLHDNAQNSPGIDDEYERTLRAYEQLKGLFESLDLFKSIGEKISESQEMVRSVAEDLRLYALNANVASETLGHQGIAIGTITQFLHSQAQMLSGVAGSFSGSALKISRKVGEIASRFASARLQLEMLLSFMGEMVRDGYEQDRLDNLLGLAQDLRGAFRVSLDLARKAAIELSAMAPDLLRSKNEIRKLIVYFKVAQIAGVTESVRVSDADQLKAMFESLKGRIESAQNELADLEDTAERLSRLAAATPLKIDKLFCGLG